MGCGASAGTRGSRAYAPSELEPTLPEEQPPALPYDPEDVVLAEAHDSATGITHLVFVWGGSEVHEPAVSVRPSTEDLSPAQRSSVVTSKRQKEALKRARRAVKNATRKYDTKLGSFYAKEKKSVGVWRINGNVLELVWSEEKTDSVIAMRSDREWINPRTSVRIQVVEPENNPRWFRADVHSHRFELDTVHGRNFECPVCYHELWRLQGSVIRHHSRRSCGHYFHLPCAKYLQQRGYREGKTAMCPVCHSHFTEVQPLPDLATDRRSWFTVCDYDLSGTLEQVEVVEALGATLPVARDKLERRLKAYWKLWDPDGDGRISMSEFLRHGKGLCDWILRHHNTFRKPVEVEVPPNLDQNPRAWFEHWDKDCSDSLEREEVIRALVRSFCSSSTGDPILKWAHDMREAAQAVWQGLGYKAFDSVDFEEFTRPYGLLDQFLHNQTQTMYFGQDEVLDAMKGAENPAVRAMIEGHAGLGVFVD